MNNEEDKIKVICKYSKLLGGSKLCYTKFKGIPIELCSVFSYGCNYHSYVDWIDFIKFREHLEIYEDR